MLLLYLLFWSRRRRKLYAFFFSLWQKESLLAFEEAEQRIQL